MKKLGILVLAMALVFGMSLGVMAQDQTNDQQIKAQVSETTFLSVQSVDFGDVEGPEVDDETFAVEGNLSDEDGNIYLYVASDADIDDGNANGMEVTITVEETEGNDLTLVTTNTAENITEDTDNISTVGDVSTTGTVDLTTPPNEGTEGTIVVTYTLSDTSE